MNAPAPAIVGIRYLLLSSLGAGSMGTVYRALDRLTGRIVALKKVSTSPDSHLALANEFRSLASLRHPNIVTVLDYGFDAENQPYFVMELLENARTIREAARDQPLATQVGLLTQILQALAYLHRRGIVHRDLKPGNILVADGQVKLLDFGLAIGRGAVVGTAGTLAYMAPEVLMGLPADAATDLYAVGIIAFELLAGQHPFQNEKGPESTVIDLRTTVEQILYMSPDVQSTGLEPRLGAVLSKLLAKKPEDRYTSASQVIEALNEAIDQPFAYETAAIRESFLQAAEFVGRERELDQLSAALTLAVQGKGSAWLVGGESGVGKSRLVDELRIRALVKGILVLRGQGVSEGARPYQVWCDSLRWLCLQTDLSDQEAGVIRSLVPDIETLIGRAAPTVSELDPQAAQERLIAVIEAIFERQRRPILLILEDIHWASSEGLALLARLSRRVGEWRLLIVGSYREDERPRLPGELPTMRCLKLSRLSKENIARLSESILGAAGQRRQVVSFLQREAEGNVFFLIEIVRALAEESGKLDRIGDVTLPDRVFAGGIQQIIRRRLSRVPPEAWPMLRTAAVAGRNLDLDVLRAADGVFSSAANIQHWLGICADAAVLEAQGEHWRFVHDKLREGLLAEIDPDVKAIIHWQVARAIESVYSDAPDHAPVLAHHWAQAGNTSKEAHYSALAGEQSLISSAYPEAIHYLERAVELHERSGGSEQELARLEQQLGDAHLGIGHLDDSRAHFVKALQLLHQPVPNGGPALSLSLLASIGRGVLRQATHRLLPARLIRHGQDESLLWTAHALGQLVEIAYHQNDAWSGINAVIQALNLAESLGISPELARTYAAMGNVAGGARLKPLAELYMRRAMETARQTDQLPVLAYVLTVLSVYSVGTGEWDKARAGLERSIELCSQFRDRRLWGMNTVNLAQISYFKAEFAASNQAYIDLYNEANNRGDEQQVVWGLCGQAMNALRTGQLDRAESLVSTILTLHIDESNRALISIIDAVALAVYLERNNVAAAWEIAQKIDALLTGVLSVALSTVDAYASLAAVYLTLWERGVYQASADPQTLKKLARRACQALHRYARVFPIGRPHAWLAQGRYDWMDGKPRRAFAAWEKSLQYAGRLAMPYEQGRAHAEIGRHLAADDPERQVHLERASAIFTQLGAVLDLKRVQSELSSPRDQG